MANLSEFTTEAPVWVSDRTYAVGQVVRDPADWYFRYVRCHPGAGTTNPVNDLDNWRPDGGRPIRSIQRGIAQLANPSAVRYVDVTIAAVNPAKSLLTLLSATIHGGSNSHDGAYPQQISLLNASTIRVDVGTSLWNSVTYRYTYFGLPVSWQIVEYY